MRIGIAVMLSSAVAFAEPPAPIAVKAATVASPTDGPAWKLVTTTDGTWCQAKAGVGAGEPFTITLATPAVISSVEIGVPSSSGYNTLGSAEVTADGKVFKANTVDVKVGGKSIGRGTIDVKLGGGAVSQLVVKVVASQKGANEVNCVSAIELHTVPEASVIFGVEPAAVAALWPNVVEIRDALSACDAKRLAAVAKFPVERTWYTEDNDGMKEKTAKYKTAAALAKACKKKQLIDATGGMKLASPHVQAESATKLEVSEDGSVWGLELAGDHWRLRAFRQG